MLENARRQLMLVLLATAAAIVAIATLPLNLGLDLSGGVQLIYEVDVERAKADGTIPQTAGDAEVSQILDETVAIIGERIDPQGTVEAVVTRRGPSGILIELPNMTDTETRAIESRVENLGRLELRMVAQDTYRKNGVRFQMTDERQRLKDWLAVPANLAEVREDPAAIRSFNLTPPDEGGPAAAGALAWFPRIIKPTFDDPARWDWPMSADGQGNDNPSNVYHAVPAFSPEEWNGGQVAEGRTQLVEFVPINVDEVFFTGEDLDPSSIRPSLSDEGRPILVYTMRPERIDAYADWTGEYTGEYGAIILNGVVDSAPRFQNRIHGNAQITGQFTQREVAELAKTLKTGSLKVKPIQQSRNVLGATLGERSIQLAFLSMAIGAAITLAFVVWYYRVAGLVAFTALIVNVLLILGIVIALRSTLTLPGLAGLVLTMGMAIDANILIYERIREELEAGKELLQSVRTGFDRALTAILDSNLTTFIAGVVLYNAGVGPVRGFAVTLMIGILTTLFTAIVLSRVIFHYLLEWKWLREFRSARLFANANYDFFKVAKRATIFSVIVIVVGLIAFVVTPADTKYAIDFTGGANLTVALKQPMQPDEMRELLEQDATFAELFPKPIVNTIGQVQDQAASRFAIRLKLTDELRREIDAARAANPQGYEAPYLTELRRILRDYLVDDASSDAAVLDVGDRPNTSYAEIALHFATDVPVESLRQSLRGLGPSVTVTALSVPETAQVARDFRVEFDVAKGTAASLLFPMVQDELSDLTDETGATIALSNPIPESSEIGGRMVGELRNSAVQALVIAMFGIVMYIRVRFHEYKYGIAAIVAVLHDVLVALGCVVIGNAMGWVDAEIDLSMIAAFLTIIGYSINDTIVIFDRVRENLSEQVRLGERVDRKALLNLSLNQTLSRTVLTTATTLSVVMVQFLVNFRSGTALEGFSFALVTGMIAGTYSTIFIASPIVLWFWNRESPTTPEQPTAAATHVAQTASTGA